MLCLLMLILLLVGCGQLSKGKYTISGRVTDASGNGVEGVTITFNHSTATVTTNAQGQWTYPDATGSMTVTPVKQGWTFTPESRLVDKANSKVDFTGESVPIVVEAIAGGQSHTIALKSDGTVWAWGHNDYGQLGDGTTTMRTTPVQVSNLSGVHAIACGTHHVVALKGDGTVWTWGRNVNGQLGDGTWTDRHTPVQVEDLNGVCAVAGGGDHTIALKCDGTVWTWGRNLDGQLGDGTSRFRNTPVQVDI
jgi:alpha-tubulin suppressor-like RCC1 family protein